MDDEAQVTLFPQDAAATLAVIQAAFNAWLSAQRMTAEASEAVRAAKKAEREAHARWLKASSTAGQLTLPDVLPSRPAATETRETIQAGRQQLRRDQAVDTLRLCGGTLSNKILASYLCLDSHGLVSLLDGDPRLEKFHSGREKNEQTFWRLRGAATVAA